MMTIFQSVAQKDSDALLIQEEPLSGHAQALLIYLQGLPKGQKAQVRKLMLDSADNPSHMRAALAGLKGHPSIVFDATGHVFFKHDIVSAPVVDVPVVENKPTHNAHRVVTRSVSNGSGANKSQQLNDWLASRTTGACNPTYQLAAGNNH